MPQRRASAARRPGGCCPPGRSPRPSASASCAWPLKSARRVPARRCARRRRSSPPPRPWPSPGPRVALRSLSRLASFASATSSAFDRARLRAASRARPGRPRSRRGAGWRLSRTVTRGAWRSLIRPSAAPASRRGHRRRVGGAGVGAGSARIARGADPVAVGVGLDPVRRHLRVGDRRAVVDGVADVVAVEVVVADVAVAVAVHVGLVRVRVVAAVVVGVEDAVAVGVELAGVADAVAGWRRLCIGLAIDPAVVALDPVRLVVEPAVGPVEDAVGVVVVVAPVAERVTARQVRPCWPGSGCGASGRRSPSGGQLSTVSLTKSQSQSSAGGGTRIARPERAAGRAHSWPRAGAATRTIRSPASSRTPTSRRAPRRPPSLPLLTGAGPPRSSSRPCPPCRPSRCHGRRRSRSCPCRRRGR